MFEQMTSKWGYSEVEQEDVLRPQIAEVQFLKNSCTMMLRHSCNFQLSRHIILW